MKPDANSLTLREAFEAFIRPDLTNPRTAESYLKNLRRWEKLTANPPVGQITNRTLAEFRNACLEQKLSPGTFNTNRAIILAILRRVGPPEGHELGEGLIDRVPFVRSLPTGHKLPHVWTLDELGRVYEACETARVPLGELPAAEMWRAVLVLGFNTLARKSDIFAMRMEAIDWQERAVSWTAQKTGKPHRIPMNPVVEAALRRIHSDREFLFPRRDGSPIDSRKCRLYKTFHEIQAAAGVSPLQGFHVLRRTGASYYRSVAGDIAKFLGGWSAGKDIADRCYLNPHVTGEVEQAVASLPQPAQFERLISDPAAKRNIFGRSVPARSTEWEFSCLSATRKGKTVRFTGPKSGRLLQVLQAFVAATKPLSAADLRGLAFWDHPDVTDNAVRMVVSRLRQKLITELDLPPLMDPIPANPDGSGWLLRLP